MPSAGNSPLHPLQMVPTNSLLINPSQGFLFAFLFAEGFRRGEGSCGVFSPKERKDRKGEGLHLAPLRLQDEKTVRLDESFFACLYCIICRVFSMCYAMNGHVLR